MADCDDQIKQLYPATNTIQLGIINNDISFIGNILFNDTLNTYIYRYMVSDNR